MTERIVGERYRIKKPLGKGGRGTVYLCHDEKLHKDWAIKELEEPSDLERSMELELLKTISCNVFPRIVDIVKENGRVFLVMDYVEGITLKEKMKQQPLSEKEVLPWAKEIARGIGYLHRMSVPILYMDCKPDNIMLTDAGEIRLVDLGSAYVCFGDKKQRISGTKYFAPKEQCKRDKETEVLDVRTDIYAFGMTLYYLLTGGEREQRRGGRLCMKEINPSVSWGMSHIIEKCTMEKAEHRYQSMEEVSEQLQHIRKVGRQKEGKVRMQKTLEFTQKALCAALVLFFAYVYQKQGANGQEWLCYAIIMSAFLLLLCRTKRSNIYEISKDIFCGKGKRFLYLLLLTGGLAGMGGLTVHAAREKEEGMISYLLEQKKKEEKLEIALYDGRGRNILIKEGAKWVVKDDICMSILLDELDEGAGRILVCYESDSGTVKKRYAFDIVK